MNATLYHDGTPKREVLLNTTQTTLRFGVCRKTLFNWQAFNGLPSIRFGYRTVRYDPKELDAWAACHHVAALARRKTARHISATHCSKAHCTNSKHH